MKIKAPVPGICPGRRGEERIEIFGGCSSGFYNTLRNRQFFYKPDWQRSDKRKNKEIQYQLLII